MAIFEEIFAWKQISENVAIRLTGFRDIENDRFVFVSGNFLSPGDHEIGSRVDPLGMGNLVEEFLALTMEGDREWLPTMKEALDDFFNRNRFD